MHAWSYVSEKTHARVSSTRFFAVRFAAKRYILRQIKVSETTNRNIMPAARNMLVQLLALCTNPESHNEARVTDRRTDRQTDDSIMPIADHTA